ncbi:MAG: PTS glucitol/sorbitol transporter subunit IIA [Clostridiales bacterium]|nr:PTS glucitol/sorbitol transporter subunit IIA [Clostridiales bacterium]
MKVIFETQILSVGKLAENFLTDSKLIVLFGNDIPVALVDYCYNIKIVPVSEQIMPGMTLILGEQSFKVTAVGDVVNHNLESLGHITISFDGKNKAELPGTLHVEKADTITANQHMTIKIIKI